MTSFSCKRFFDLTTNMMFNGCSFVLVCVSLEPLGQGDIGH